MTPILLTQPCRDGRPRVPLSILSCCSHGRDSPGIRAPLFPWQGMSRDQPGSAGALSSALVSPPCFYPNDPPMIPGSQQNPTEAEQAPVPVSPPCPQRVPTPVSPRRGLPGAPARSGSCPMPRGAAAGHFAQPHFLPPCQRDSPASFPTPRGGGSHFGPVGDGGEAAVTFPQLQGTPRAPGQPPPQTPKEKLWSFSCPSCGDVPCGLRGEIPGGSRSGSVPHSLCITVSLV